VHWTDTDSDSLFFPGPDAHIVHDPKPRQEH
jgi:Domain of unknown function (DUF1918)